MQELFKVGAIEYAIASRFRIVNDELMFDNGPLSGGSLGLKIRANARCEPTEKLTQQSSTGH